MVGRTDLTRASAPEAARLIRSGMTLGMNGFTIVGYPKAVPQALAESGHARELTICIGASVGDELDGALVRAGLVKRRFAYQSNRDMRDAINAGVVGYSDMHISQFPLYVNQRVGPKIDVAIVECTAVTKEGLIPPAAVGCMDAVVRAAGRAVPVRAVDSLQATTARDAAAGATYLGAMAKNLETFRAALGLR